MGAVLGCFIVEIIFFTVFFVSSRIKYNRRFSQKYDLRNMFPYELNYESKFQDNFIGNITFILMVLSHVGVFVFSMDTLIQSTLAFNLVAALLTSITTLLILFVPLKLLKTHLICTTLFIISTFLSFASIGYTTLNFSSLLNYNYLIILAIISFAFALVVFGIIMNPKLTMWAKAEKLEVDGQVVYKRPKYIVLAFSEWLCILLNLAAGLLQTILFLIIYM